MKLQCLSTYGELGTPKTKFCVIKIPHETRFAPFDCTTTVMYGKPSELDEGYRFFVGTIAESGDLEPYQECATRDEAWFLAAEWNRKEEQSS